MTISGCLGTEDARVMLATKTMALMRWSTGQPRHRKHDVKAAPVAESDRLSQGIRFILV